MGACERRREGNEGTLVPEAAGERPSGNAHFWAFSHPFAKAAGRKGRVEGGQVSPVALSPPAWRDTHIKSSPSAALLARPRCPPGRGSSIFLPALAARRHFVAWPPPFCEAASASSPFCQANIFLFRAYFSSPPPFTKRAALKTPGGG